MFDLNELAEASDFNASRRTVILVPGYRSEKNEKWMHEAKNIWLDLEDVNVILVNWHEGSSGFYHNVVKNTRIVGRQIVILLYYLAKLNNVDFKSEQYRSKILLVGYSCGAHIAGFVGKQLGGQVDRITGLDPAGPIFDTLNETDHLNAKNAKLVDIIHTNAGKIDLNQLYTLPAQNWVKQKYGNFLDWFRFSKDKSGPSFSEIVEQAMQVANITALSNSTSDDVELDKNTNTNSNTNETSPSKIRYGIDKQIGHIDYYVNGGSSQPGCTDLLSICNHNRSIEIYLKTLEHQLQARQQAAYDSRSRREEEGKNTFEGEESGSIIKEAESHRLIAFAANSYEDFKTGANLIRNCAKISLLSPAAFASKENFNDKEFDEEFEHCAIPIDFVKSADEYRAELFPATRGDDGYDGYGDSDQNNSELQANNRFYFDTLAYEPFVSDYYLMRLHVPSLVFGHHDHRWSTGFQVTGVGQCKLFSSLHSLKTDNKHRFSSQLVEYKPWKYSAPNNYYSNLYIGLVLPLLNPNSWRLYFPTRQFIYKQILKSNTSALAASMLYNMLPNALSIGMIHIKQKQQQHQQQQLSNSDSISNDTQTKCNINYSEIELIPLSKALSRSFSLWFAANDNITDCATELDSREAERPIIIEKPYQVNHSISLNWTEQVCNIPLRAISLLSQS